MKSILYLFLIAVIPGYGQALRDLNYRFLYDGQTPFTLHMKPVRGTGQWTVPFNLTMQDTTQNVSVYSIVFNTRAALSDKEGSPVSADSITLSAGRKGTISGTVMLPLSSQKKILVAKVVKTDERVAWLLYAVLDPAWPETIPLKVNGSAMVKNYVRAGDNILHEANNTQVVSYYSDVFPAAAPAFSEALGKVSKGMKPDSTFLLPAGQPLVNAAKGLYLLQQDTLASLGTAFRVEDDYPRYAKVESLADPLIYICTKQEFERIKAAKGDKRAFDRVILGVTGDAGRARTFMKNYFRRVEQANTYFTSYKEGWKTDRGMIFIIFGPPTEAFRFMDREVWNYKTGEFKITFEFTKAPSVFDPDNFVLIRNNKYTQTWYEVIDLWRNARF